MAVINVNGISGINSITAQSSSLNFFDSAGQTLSIGASVSGNITGNVTGNLTGNVSGNVTGNVTGNVNSSGVSTITTLSASSIIGVSTLGVTTAYVTQLAGVGAGTSIQIPSGSKLVGLTTGSVYAPGTIIQVVSSTPTNVTASSNTHTTLLSQSITPTFATSKILVHFSAYMGIAGNSTRLTGFTQLLRGVTVIWGPYYGPSDWVDAGSYHFTSYSGSFTYLDSPATTSSVTYNLQGREDSDQTSSYSGATLILMEVAQ